MKKSVSLFAATFAVVLIGCVLAPVYAQQKPVVAPTRLSSTGDSITEAIDAELPLANHWASWTNGYTNFWTWLFGLTNVDSHFQRIQRNLGGPGLMNFMEARSGADSFDFPGQTAMSVAHAATYVTVLMGHNDVCQNNFSEIPTDAEFEANMRAGFENLKNGLPTGSVVYVLSTVDIYQLWRLGRDLTALGFIDCQILWATTLLDLFPCGTMLNPLNSEADRQFTRGRNIRFNQILQALVDEYEASDPNHNYRYTPELFEARFFAADVSPIDCFHPSAEGQTKLAYGSWLLGPWGRFQN